MLARAGAGKMYVFAVNAAAGARSTIQMHVPALRNGPVTVFGERRAVTANAGRFNDSFTPLGVHIYVQSRH